MKKKAINLQHGDFARLGTMGYQLIRNPTYDPEKGTVFCVVGIPGLMYIQLLKFSWSEEFDVYQEQEQEKEIETRTF